MEKQVSREKPDQIHEPYKTIYVRPSKVAWSYLARKIKIGIDQGVRAFRVKFATDGKGLFPNNTLPIAAVIDRCKRQNGAVFWISKDGPIASYADHIGLMSVYNHPQQAGSFDFLDKVWRYDAETHQGIVNGMLNSLRGSVALAPRLLNALELCINEVTDNALVHSYGLVSDEKPHGYIMVQVHHRSNRIAVSIFDDGMGIPCSLKQAGLVFSNDEEALMLSLERGVTDGKGAGNGLWMLRKIVEYGKGSLEIVSNGASLSLRHFDTDGQLETHFTKRKKGFAGTTLIDFQLDVGREVVLRDALDGYEHVDLWMEGYEDSINPNDIHLPVAELARGTGTREEAKEFSLTAINVQRSIEGAVLLDFEGISVVSASFADEVIGRLIDEYGLSGYSERFKLANVGEDCRAVIDSVIERRLNPADE